MGSRDRSLSVWMTALQRPLVVIHDLFQDSILDLSWSTDNNILLACSTDGTVACLQFAPNELGTPLSEDDKVRPAPFLHRALSHRPIFHISELSVSANVWQKCQY